GLYFVLFSICVYILFYKKGKNSPLNKPLIATTITLFIMCTTHIVVDFVRGWKAFFNSPMSPLDYYVRIWDPLNIFKQALLTFSSVVSDGLVVSLQVYRCYIIWGRRYSIVVIPIIMPAATTVCAFLAVYNFSKIQPGESVFTSIITEWATALFSLSLATNVIITTLIASRIWALRRQASSTLGRRHTAKYTNAMTIIIESGAIYSASVMTLLILYCRRTNAQYIIYDTVAQVMAIVPTMIIMRVGLGISTEDVATYGTRIVVHDPEEGRRTFALPMRFRQNLGTDAPAYELDARVTRSSITDKVPVLGQGSSQ
ncbi:hypothetical protein DICSQDRAFT_63334, partial [Dichomitus squalens LYAD-421 SS1]